jgi:hypothetical protein
MTYLHGQRKIPVMFFYSHIQDLRLDPFIIKWPDQLSILNYWTEQGRALLRKFHVVEDLATKKWYFILPKFKFAWEDTWKTTRERKEATLIWQM